MEKYEWRKVRDLNSESNAQEDFSATSNKVIEAPAHGPFTQTNFYASWQRNLNRNVEIFNAVRMVSNLGTEGKSVFETEVVAKVLLVTYPLVAGKNYIYAPYGPVLFDEGLINSSEFLKSLKDLLQEVCRKQNAVFARLDFSYPSIFSTQSSEAETKNEQNNFNAKLLSGFFKKAPSITYHSAYFQPRYEWFLKIDKSEEEILKEMHEKTRYSVRLSARKEIETKIVTTKDEGGPMKYFEDFYSLMNETAKRNGFSLHTKKYYEGIFESLSTSKELENSYLAIAYFKEKILAMDLVIVHGKIANYVFGASNNEERNRMPAHSAQWTAIKYAKSLGCDLYNFGGVSLEGKKHVYKGWEGLTSFKQKFGGYAVSHLDFFDYVALPLWYHAYNLRKYLKKFLPFI